MPIQVRTLGELQALQKGIALQAEHLTKECRERLESMLYPANPANRKYAGDGFHTNRTAIVANLDELERLLMFSAKVNKEVKTAASGEGKES